MEGDQWDWIEFAFRGNRVGQIYLTISTLFFQNLPRYLDMINSGMGIKYYVLYAHI